MLQIKLPEVIDPAVTELSSSMAFFIISWRSSLIPSGILSGGGGGWLCIPLHMITMQGHWFKSYGVKRVNCTLQVLSLIFPLTIWPSELICVFSKKNCLIN